MKKLTEMPIDLYNVRSSRLAENYDKNTLCIPKMSGTSRAFQPKNLGHSTQQDPHYQKHSVRKNTWNLETLSKHMEFHFARAVNSLILKI